MPSRLGNRRIYLIAAAIALVIIAGFVFSAPHLKDASAPSAHNAGVVATATPIVYLHDSYKKGTHTVSGEVLAADACALVSPSASVVSGAASGTPDTILVALDMPPDTGICLEEPATSTFTLSVQAASDAVFAASINGTDASTSSY